MAAPNLQAEGSIAAVTTGDLTVTLPAHQADDILVVTVLTQVENTAGTAAETPTPSGWTKSQGYKDDDLEASLFWKRAASGSETNPVFTRGSGWDTGNDTFYGGRAYVIRGADTNDPPWDELDWTTPYVDANQAFDAVTVSGSERMVVQFYLSLDDLSAGAAPSGWTAGTQVTSTTGTDGGFQTFRKDNVSTSTGADASAAAAQPGYWFVGISFKPVAAAASRHRDVIGTLL